LELLSPFFFALPVANSLLGPNQPSLEAIQVFGEIRNGLRFVGGGLVITGDLAPKKENAKKN